MLVNSVTSIGNAALGILSIMLRNFVPGGTSTRPRSASFSVLGLAVSARRVILQIQTKRVIEGVALVQIGDAQDVLGQLDGVGRAGGRTGRARARRKTGTRIRKGVA